ncbi:MAG: hypothetical protein FWE89_06745, partial [Syntrophaceae bacterium]|nr:hypothetical protein [Syntrophaceae bacterium]
VKDKRDRAGALRKAYMKSGAAGLPKADRIEDLDIIEDVDIIEETDIVEAGALRKEDVIIEAEIIDAEASDSKTYASPWSFLQLGHDPPGASKGAQERRGRTGEAPRARGGPSPAARKRGAGG